jgi:hypothetical protein
MAARASEARLVADLGEVKDAIGEWHDWQELVQIAQKVLSHGEDCQLARDYRQIAESRFEDSIGRAQRLRDEYLRKPQTRKAASRASGSIPAEPLWDAVAMLTG